MNVPEFVNSTVVPSSINIVRAISIAICNRTGQSITSVNAACLAASKARITPGVSSEVPEQLTHLLMDCLTADTPIANGASVEVAAPSLALMAMLEYVPTLD